MKEQMTEKQILLEAIGKAAENGYDASVHLTPLSYMGSREYSLEDYIWLSKDAIIFDKKFAHAFWGDGLVKTFPLYINKEDIIDAPIYMEEWIDGLQQLALSDDRMEYIKGFLN